MKNIPFGKPMIGDDEREAVCDILSGTTFVHGATTHKFEESFAKRAGARHGISLSSCTAGLHLSLFVNGISSGDKVVVPAMTHVATAHAVEYCGAEPVFVDVEEDSGNIDPNLLQETVSDDVKAIMVVHYLGLPCEMSQINDSARKYGAFVIEDCALALDATYNDKKVGTHGLAGCFSFYPVKHMTTLEGGMLTTDDDDLAHRIKKSKAFGYDRSLGERAKPGIYDVDMLGYNYRMNEVEAAIGLVQLEKLDSFQQRRRENFRTLYAELAEVSELTIFNPVKNKAKSSHYCLNITLPKDGRINRDDFVSALKDSGIGSSVHYPSAVPLFTFYQEKYGYKAGQFPVAEWLAAQTISLPIGPHLAPQDASFIGQVVKKAIMSSKI